MAREYREKYPDSKLLEEMRPLIEGPAFVAAHAMGTAEAYDRFVERFFIRGQSRLRQRRMALSSRSRARCSGL